MNWFFAGLAAFIIGIGISSKKEAPLTSPTRAPASEPILPVQTQPQKTSQPRESLAAPSAEPTSRKKLSYKERREKWISESSHVHKWRSLELAPPRTAFEKKWHLGLHGDEVKMSSRMNQLIFINAGRSLNLHICPYSGVTLNKLVDMNQSGTFYFQEGHTVSFNNLKASRFCSITLAKKTNIKEKVVFDATVIEKKADFRFLPNFTGVRHYFARDPKNQVIEEISCYTPVMNPKDTEYDDLEERDMAFAFYTLLDF